jgi:hypothetical protein
MSVDPVSERLKKQNASRNHLRRFVRKSAAALVIALLWRHHDFLLTFSAGMCLYAALTAPQALFRKDAFFARHFTLWDETLWLSLTSLGALVLYGAMH